MVLPTCNPSPPPALRGPSPLSAGRSRKPHPKKILRRHARASDRAAARRAKEVPGHALSELERVDALVQAAAAAAAAAAEAARREALDEAARVLGRARGALARGAFEEARRLAGEAGEGLLRGGAGAAAEQEVPARPLDRRRGARGAGRGARSGARRR
jgi:hypothetical protein